MGFRPNTTLGSVPPVSASARFRRRFSFIDGVLIFCVVSQKNQKKRFFRKTGSLVGASDPARCRKSPDNPVFANGRIILHKFAMQKRVPGASFWPDFLPTTPGWAGVAGPPSSSVIRFSRNSRWYKPSPWLSVFLGTADGIGVKPTGLACHLPKTPGQTDILVEENILCVS